jgi:ribose transport system substrate-binding protein
MKPLRWLVCSAIFAILATLPACSSSKPDNKPNTSNQFGKYTLFDTRYDQVDLAKAKNNAADVLTRLEGKDNICLIGLWAYNPPAILNAVKDAGKEGKVKIVGFDEYDDTLQGIKDGNIHATVVQNPYEFGYQSVKLLAALARHEKTPLPKEVKDGIWNIPHRVIKKDNVDKFWTELKGLKEKAKGADPEGEISVAFVSNNAEEFWTFAEAGAKVAARESKVNLIFKKPKSGTADEQVQTIRDILGKVKGVAVSVNDPKNQKEFLDEVADKVSLITVDNDAPNTKRKCYIGTNNIAAGREVGKLVKEAMPDGGNIAIFVGKPDPINAQERREGVLDELAGK